MGFLSAIREAFRPKVSTYFEASLIPSGATVLLRPRRPLSGAEIETLGRVATERGFFAVVIEDDQIGAQVLTGQQAPDRPSDHADQPGDNRDNRPHSDLVPVFPQPADGGIERAP